MFLKQLKSAVYNKAIRFTSGSYTEVLTVLLPNTRMLDVGVGTAHALLQNAHLVRGKNIKIVGIDIDTAYLEEATQAVASARLQDCVTIQHTDICEGLLSETFDAVYFSDSFMLIPKAKRVTALHNAIHSLKDASSKIFFTQTHESHRSKLLEYIKPRIKLFTSIDFGLVTYEDEFLETIASVGLEVVDQKVLYGNKKRSMVLITTSPKNLL